MSQQRDSAVSGPPSSSVGSGGYARPTAAASHTSSSPSHLAIQPIRRTSGHEADSRALPPIRHQGDMSPRASSHAMSAPRPGALQSILNPSPADTAQPQGRRRSAAQMNSPLPSDATLGSLGRASYRTAEPIPGDTERHHGHRRILTPRSPALHRVQSIGTLGIPSATINAQQSPFLTPASRSYTAEPGVGGTPLLPTPPTAHRSSYFPPSAPTPPLNPASRRASIIAASASASPTSSSYSYGPSGQHSPALLPVVSGTGSLSSYFPSHSGIPDPSPGPASSSVEAPRPYGIPMATSGQTNYQMLRIETQSGPVQLPVDVQAASKVADEKRKRNAGASARFRARRKEKEKESSATISRLEQEVRHATEDADFYKRERDYLATAILQTPGGSQHFPRPQSPRINRRVSIATSVAGDSTSGSVTSGYPERRDSFDDSGRNVRRRTSSYALPAPQQGNVHVAQRTGGPASYPHLAPAGTSGQMAQQQHGPPGPHSQHHFQPSHQHPSQNQNEPQRYGPHETSSSAVERYERGWAPHVTRESRR